MTFSHCELDQRRPASSPMTGLSRLRRASGAAILLGVLFVPAAVRTEGSPPRPAASAEPITALHAPEPGDPRRIALGEALFSDTRLSGDGTRSCGSCHDLTTNGASGERRDRGPDGHELDLNTNTVFNAALSFRLGWAGHQRTLEEQARVSLTRSDIMATTPEAAAERLRADADLARRFRDAYGQDLDAAVLLDAIGSFERTLVTPGSRFDQWLDGDADALTPEAVDGYHLFKTLGCVSCHQGANVGGNLFEVHGVFRAVGTSNPPLLRVPSLRNVAATPPYFHDGGAATLEAAVHEMATAQLGRDLSDAQVGQITAFLRSLTGFYRGRQINAPAR